MAILCFLLGSGAGAAPAPDPPGPGRTFELPRMPRGGEQLVLSQSGDRLAIRQSAPPARLAPLPLASDILGEAAPAIFGAEERCRLRNAGPHLELDCAPGRAPAGLLLRFDARFPRGGDTAGAIRAGGDAGFLAQFGHAGEDADEARPVSGGPLPLPQGRGSGPIQLSVLAPAAGGTLRIAGLSLVSRRAPPTSPPRAAAWAWEPELWQQRGNDLLRAAAARGLDRLIVTLAIREGRVDRAAALGRFVAAARRRGIAIEAVEGDPGMVTASGLAAAEARARAIAAYQRSAPAQERLAGIQYDIEPYTGEAWGRHPADYRGWSHAVRALARALGEPMHLVLPFWLAEEEEGPGFLREVEAAISGVTIMAYRTDAASVTRIAEPLLAWGGTAGKPVRIALEAGPVGAETEELFARAPRGRIAVAQADGTVTATLLRDDAAVPGASMFASIGRTETRPGRISFLGAEDRMIATADALRAPLAAWSAFAGFSYHGLAWR